MRIRTFTASSMQSAMADLRAELGPDAVILSSVTDKPSGKVMVTAGMESPDAPPSASPSASTMRAITASKGQEWLEELASLLRYHNTPEPLAGRLLYKARHLELEKLFALHKFGGEDRPLLEAKALSKLLETSFRFTPLLSQPGLRVMLVGPPGIGKTVAIAKLAAQLVMDKSRVTVISTDNKRAGGVEQLAAFTDILELPLKVADSPAELTAALHATEEGERVLIDTAGCNPYDKADLDELSGLVEVGGFEPMLVLPAGVDSHEAADAARAFSFTAIQRMLVTRMDTARRFGSLLAAADARPLAFACLSNSARVVGELKPLNPALLAQLMLQSRLQSV